MSSAGEAEFLVRVRKALLDALDALDAHLNSVVVIGAQAIYLHTGRGTLALAEMTKDSDLSIDPRSLSESPRIEEAMRDAGFDLNPDTQQPGAWIDPDGTPVDLMVPESLAGRGGSRSARIPPHGNRAMRRATGLEATVVDHHPMRIEALDESDPRIRTVNVASPAALLVAKLHKIADRRDEPTRLFDKDAHDIYRLIASVSMERFVRPLQHLTDDETAGESTRQALRYLEEMFANGPDAVGSMMAGRAEQGIGDPDAVSASVALLAREILTAVDPDGYDDLT